MEKDCPSYAWILNKPSFFVERLSECYLGECEVHGIAKWIVEKYQGDELVEYLSKLLFNWYTAMKDAQRGSRKGVDINIRISSDGVTAKVEKQ